MNEKTEALIARIQQLRVQSQALEADLGTSPSAVRLLRRLTAATTAVDTFYCAAATANSGNDFIRDISAAARHARRARRILQDLILTAYVDIEIARDLVLEARGIEAILTASKHTASRH